MVRCRALACDRDAGGPPGAVWLGDRGRGGAVRGQPVWGPNAALSAGYADLAAHPEQHPGVGIAGLPLDGRPDVRDNRFPYPWWAGVWECQCAHTLIVVDLRHSIPGSRVD